MNNLIIKKVIHIAENSNIITDNALKRLINSFLGKSVDDDITAAELAGIDFIDASNDTTDKAQSLAGLENAFSLLGIDISGNNISDIIPLKDLDLLNYLTAEGNKITNLQNINGNIVDLGLQENGIEDITGISVAANITDLNLVGNTIKDISELSQLTALNKVILTKNKIADVSILNGFQVEDSNEAKWAALGGQFIDFDAVYYEKDNNNITITLPLEGKLKDLNGAVPSIINNIIYKDINDGIVVIGSYDDNSKSINYPINEIPQLVSFDFNTTTDNTLADSFNGNVIAYVAIKIENGVIESYINEKIKEAGGIENIPILYKDYKESEIDTLTDIDLSNKGLTNLKDIDLFPGAVNINLANNKLVDMSDFFKLDNIRDRNVAAENQSHQFDYSIISGKDYSFNLDKLSVNETGNSKFEVEFEVPADGISHNGVYNSLTNTIKWTGLNKDSVLTFNYIKIYKEPEDISGASIGRLAAGDQYDNIVNTGTVTVNLTVNVSRGLDLF